MYVCRSCLDSCSLWLYGAFFFFIHGLQRGSVEVACINNYSYRGGCTILKKNLIWCRLCANFCPLSRDFWIFLWCVFFLQTGVSLRKPENLIFHSKGTLECFHTHM